MFEVCQAVNKCSLSSRGVFVETNQPLGTVVLLYSDLAPLPWFFSLRQARSSVSHTCAYIETVIVCFPVCKSAINVLASGAASGFLCCCF